MCQGVPVDEAGLLAELRELHRGRGVRRPALRTWCGPQLREAAGIDAEMSDAVARATLVEFLKDRIGSFPRDLRYLFEVASGISVDRPFLEQRLALAEKALDRGPRVLRRRLRSAEQLLADGLLPDEPDAAGDPFDLRGWEWVAQDYRLRFDPEPEFTIVRSIRALRRPLTSIREMFVFPHPAGGDAVLGAEGLAGCRLMTLERESPNGWAVEWSLDEPLPPGATRTLAVRIRPPGRHVMAPIIGIGPLRPMRLLRLSVDFGDPPVASSAWRLEGVMSTLLLNYIDGSERYDPAVTREVSVEFENPKPGLMYALAWEWAPG